jgi:hypothetical protein
MIDEEQGLAFSSGVERVRPGELALLDPEEPAEMIRPPLLRTSRTGHTRDSEYTHDNDKKVITGRR